MASIFETGHAKNVASFHRLISFVAGYGAAYNPTEPALQLAGLQGLYANAQAALINVRNKHRDYENIVNDRKILFKDLKPFASRLVNFLKSSKVSSELLDDALGVTRKMRGGRARSVVSAVNVDMTVNMPTRNSTSQQSYIQLASHFSDLVTLLSSSPNYRPNEPEAQIANLQAMEQQLINANTQIDIYYVQVSNARIERDNILYKNPINLYTTAIDVKNYIRGIFGAKSPQYGQVKSLKLTKPVR